MTNCLNPNVFLERDRRSGAFSATQPQKEDFSASFWEGYARRHRSIDSMCCWPVLSGKKRTRKMPIFSLPIQADTLTLLGPRVVSVLVQI